MKRKKPVRRVGPKRDQKWLRAYGSPARVAFVKSLPCAVCGTTATERHNAHLPSKHGMGLKGPYTDIVPACQRCHDRMDGRALPPIPEHEWPTLVEIAAQVQRDWLDYAGEIAR